MENTHAPSFSPPFILNRNVKINSCPTGETATHGTLGVVFRCSRSKNKTLGKSRIGGCADDSLSWGNPCHSLHPVITKKKYTPDRDRAASPTSPKTSPEIVYWKDGEHCSLKASAYCYVQGFTEILRNYLSNMLQFNVKTETFYSIGSCPT